jgi:serine/threonine protein kinase, bacterial
MAYCHECGEKVAEIDVYCPYCGISLQPISIAGEDISFEKTIVADAPAVPEKPREDSQTYESSGSTTEEGFYPKTEEVEIPAEVFEEINAPAAIADSSEPSAAAQAPAEEKAEISAPEILQENEQTPPVPLPENIEILKPLQDDAENVSAEASENKETIDDDSFVMPQPDSVDKPEETESSESSNDAEMESRFSEAETSLYPSGTFPSEEFLSEPKEEESAAPGETEAPVEDAISKPKDDLEPAPRPSSESVFDSVQIVQPVELSEVKAPDAEEEKPEPISSEQAPSESEDKEGRSFTTPNFTGSDTDGKSGSKLKPLDEGTVLNSRYEIVRKIGGGGMGAVYLASDKNLGGVLRAVKEMVQSYIEETQQDKAVADFKRESMLLTSLEHQAIPTIFDYFYDEKEARFYLVMKYISGGDLASRLRSAPEGRIDEQTVTDWGIQIADVLDYLHNRQPPIVYRDLKPANIMIDGNSGRIMLIDFGIARWVNKEEKGVTAVGTMGYAPPELFSGNVESRSDIYSLGSTMFHLLTGADPQSNPLLIFDFQKNPRPRQINPQLSDQIERILMRAVEYNSDKRFASAAEMKQALQEHLDNLKASRVTFGVKEVPASVTLSEQPVFCGFCGQKIVATDMFCAFCGAKQPIAQQGVHISPGGAYSAPGKTAKLMILGTNDLESPSFYLEKDENLVGRRDPMSNIFPEIDLSKFDPQTKISRRHARIWREGASYLVEDLGSSNGTILLPVVNETIRLLPHQPHVLSNGDKLKVGDTTMHFVIG